MNRRMSRREYLSYLNGNSEAHKFTLKAATDRKVQRNNERRYCHSCGSLLTRRIYVGSIFSKKSDGKKGATDAKTESKEAFAMRHFCNAFCRASCRGAQISTIPKSRFS